jgi:hypothetical protein
MNTIKSCEYNIDTACVEVIYENGSTLSIYTPMIEESLRTAAYSLSKLNWLIDNEPLEYVRMVLDGTMQEYLYRIDGVFYEQEKTISKQIQKKKGCSESMADYLAREYLMYDS